MSQFIGTTWRNYTTANGLADNEANSIVIDSDDSIWFGIDRGVSKFTPSPSNRVTDQNTSPSPFLLRQNYPNPFNPSTTIPFTLQRSGIARIAVYNLYGQLVKNLADGRFSAGAHTVTWDGRGSNGKPVASGVYLYELSTPAGVERKKMLLVQ